MRHVLITIVLALLLGACAAPQPQVRASLDVAQAVGGDDNAAYAQVLAPRPFVFPRDHGPHPGYRIEWWYFTGNLEAGGRPFGFQLTFFRNALAPAVPERPSAWGAANIYMAHLAVTDVETGRFYAYERFSRDGAGLAGGSGEPFRVFLEDWSVAGSGPEGMTMRLRAAEDEVDLDLTLVSAKPPVLQGDRGLSQKGPDPGNASYYYSLTRMEAAGSLTLAGQPYAVSGLAWMDHEWGSTFLARDAAGWDWISAQLDDGYDLMVAQVRDQAGGPLGMFGVLVAPDGATTRLDPATLVITPLDTWRSPRSGAVYPSGWRVSAPEPALDLELQPALRDQELPLAFIYWEGSVRAMGTLDGRRVSGRGYVELTGYTP